MSVVGDVISAILESGTTILAGALGLSATEEAARESRALGERESQDRLRAQAVQNRINRASLRQRKRESRLAHTRGVRGLELEEKAFGETQLQNRLNVAAKKATTLLNNDAAMKKRILQIWQNRGRRA